ncbi:protein translocase subunit SecD [Micrococcus luteus]|uniref:protein translocase subunit SecD n=1 Tax=Micrococcus luteus TaxID=1270 RepID=UPI0035198842
MAKRTPTGSAGRTLAWLAALLVVLAAILGGGVASGAASWAPKLALDLEGGTQMVLAPETSTGESVTPEQLDQAVEIIRQRVDGSGVAEAEVATQGSQNVVVSLPGVPDEETRRLIQASADMQFRPVLQSGSGEATPEDQRLPEDQLPAPDGEPADAYDPNWVTPALLAEFQATDCTAPRDPAAPPPPSDRAIVACQPSEELADGAVTPAQKYILGPVVIPGTQIKGASNGMAQAQSGVSTNQWVVNIDFDEEGAKTFTEVTQKLTPYPEGDPRKQFAILLDGDVISAPQSNVVITNGSAQISGPTLNEQTTAQLAEQLDYGSLPISFSIESEQQISATLGRDQLFWGLIAGLIGLGLVAVYQFFQYRALGLLTFASILVAGVLTWLAIAILGWTDNYRLSLAGIAGLIVAIGLTADSFIVYFERIKDELRAGHTVPVAVHEGWKRAQRTITASKAVNLLAAVVLYFVAVGNVRGFAFTLGLTAIADLIVVFMFTHPLMVLLAQTRFVGEGHPMSGLDPSLLGGPSLYQGAGRFREPATGLPAEAADESTGAGDAEAADAPRPLVATGAPRAGSSARGGRRSRTEPPMTIAERRRAERRRQEEDQ